MNKSKQNYAKKCKTRTITFYKKDQELYEFSKTINFQDFVKTCLRYEVAEEKNKAENIIISLNEEDYGGIE